MIPHIGNIYANYSYTSVPFYKEILLSDELAKPLNDEDKLFENDINIIKDILIDIGVIKTRFELTHSNETLIDNDENKFKAFERALFANATEPVMFRDIYELDYNFRASGG